MCVRANSLNLIGQLQELDKKELNIKLNFEPVNLRFVEMKLASINIIIRIERYEVFNNEKSEKDVKRRNVSKVGFIT